MNVMQRGLIGLVKGYRLFLSPWLGASCRFEPTCSVYAIEALQCHGAAAGSYLAVARIARCNPACQGGCDPVPESAPRLFSRWLGRAAESDPSDPSVTKKSP